jgi:hypothetical protein
VAPHKKNNKTELFMSQLFFGVEKNSIRIGVACGLSFAAASVLAFTPQHSSKQLLALQSAPSSIQTSTTQSLSIFVKPSQNSSFVRPSALLIERTPTREASKSAAPKSITFTSNAFLLGSTMTNDSQLAQLQMQPVFADVESQVWLNDNVQSLSAKRAVGQFDHVGFPHIERNNRSMADQYKPYRSLLAESSFGDNGVVPNVYCMGLKPTSVAKRVTKYESHIMDLSVKYNVSASLVKAVITKESCFNPEARSHVGAIGLMQLMPETATWLKVSSPENPLQNMKAGIRYLGQLRKRFGSDELALAAYNAGPGNVERYNGIPPFAETQNYVKDVMFFYQGYRATTRYNNEINDTIITASL